MFRAVLLASSILAAPAYADPLASDGVSVAEASDPIVVTGQRDAKRTATATKTDTPVKDVPQAMTSISKAQIDEQQLRSVGEVLLFVPGAGYGSGEGNRDQITLRGNGSTADFFTDGIRDDVQYFRDFYNVERVEVLKGPNAMIFGRGGGGGVVNRVTKRAGFTAGNEFAAGIDSEGGARLTGDVEQPLSDTIALRLNAMAEDGDSFRRHVDLKRYGLNPTVAIRVGADTSIDLGYELLHDRRTADRGVPSVTDPAAVDEPLTGHDDDFFGDPDQSFARVDANIGTLAIEHRFGGGVTLRNRTSYADYDKFYQNVFASNLDEATEEVVLAGYNNGTHRKNLFSQTDLVWTGRLAGVEQALLLGFELGRQSSRNRRSTALFAGSNRAPLSDPTVDADVTFVASATDANNRGRATVAAFYAQDQIKPAAWIEIVAGLRFDRFRLAVDDYRGPGAEYRRTDHLVSPRLGLVLKPSGELSLYGSYSRSFLPQSGDQFSSLDATTGALKPERFENYEVGAKWQPLAGVLATAALYRLDRTNTRAVDPNDSTHVVLTGGQRSKGLELGIEGSIAKRWTLSAGYAWQSAEITDSTTAAPAGRKVPLVPKHSASLWARHEVNKSLGVGLGVIARSKSFATISNQVKLPGYARIDGAMFYKVSRQVQAQLNVQNILGTHYFPTANSDNNIAPGAPRTLRATLRFGL